MDYWILRLLRKRLKLRTCCQNVQVSCSKTIQSCWNSVTPTALEAVCNKKDEEIAHANALIKNLEKKVQRLIAEHKLEEEEMMVRMKQEIYMTKRQMESERKPIKHKQKL